MAGEADSVSSVSALACHIGGPNSVNTGQILLVYGTLETFIENRIFGSLLHLSDKLHLLKIGFGGHRYSY